MDLLKSTLYFIALVQFVLGVSILLIPRIFYGYLDLTDLPDWSIWQFHMLAARFLGYAYGMYVSAQNPEKHKEWITSMIIIQAIDWFSTLYHLFSGILTISQVTTAAFLPPVFVLILFVKHPSRNL